MVISNNGIEKNLDSEYSMRELKASDAVELARIYSAVYKGNYPVKEFEDPEWIKNQVDNHNIIWKVCANSRDKPVGCGVMLLDSEQGRLFAVATLLSPELQGMGIMKRIGDECIQGVINELGDKLRIFYGEARTILNGIAMQRTMEKLGFRPCGLMPDMDTGLEKRESEILLVMLFRSAYLTRRKDVKILPEIAPFYEIARKSFPKIGRNFEIIDVNSSPKISYKMHWYYKPGKYADEFYIENNDANLRASINNHAESLEVIQYTPNYPEFLKVFLHDCLMICKTKKIKFVKAYASAYEPEEQRVFLDMGFKPAGYFPAYEMVNENGEDRILMIKNLDKIMTKGFEFTSRFWKTASKILQLMRIEGNVIKTKQGNFQFYPKKFFNK
ncbi:MAG: GNAT family N-acetyltransferase [Candidatus Helarchaeota archaeon]